LNAGALGCSISGAGPTAFALAASDEIAARVATAMRAGYAQRGVRAEQVRDAVAMLRAQGIETGMFLMWGYEGEELSDIEATIEHVKESNPDIFFTTVAYPIKGTPYHSEVKERLRTDRPWEDATDRGFIERRREPGHPALVSVSASGAAHLSRHRKPSPA